MFFMGMYFLRSKNPIQKFLWLGIAVMSFIVLLATANRGAFVALMVGIFYMLYLFRSRLNIVQYVIIGSLLVSAFAVGQIMLDKYTFAVSITQRFTGTEFHGVVPDTRVQTWMPALEKATESIFFGHGPYFNIIFEGMERNLWPHNAYIYYLCTIGLFGLIPFLLILLSLLRISLQHRNPAASGTFSQFVMRILHVNFIMFLIEQTRTDHQRNGDFIYPYIVWMLFGLIVATANLIKEREEQLEGRREREVAKE
jgi:O-antigen ligase